MNCVAEGDETNSPEILSEELSSSTFAALQQFLAEQKNAETAADDPFAENWGKSQFWYDTSTAATVAEEVFELSQQGVLSTACIACPSLFRELKTSYPEAKVQLLEYDERFAVFADEFTFYDYNEPTALPPALEHAFDVIIADPPYLSKECLAKTAETVRFLARQDKPPAVLLLTGAVQRERARKLLSLRPCKFRPQHRHKLGNEFLLFTSYPPAEEGRLGGWEAEQEDQS
eukprot:TRINITY_DN10462_c0_g1_i1.p1 TRINITY_DN10462_c0_g1~~TRINITY_DN10462_c0_g1_i1.p1  ORF type:complete len:231 (-),score=49.31 TRINITY_DN10462_c0_g1_i1:673-1365(-)